MRITSLTRLQMAWARNRTVLMLAGLVILALLGILWGLRTYRTYQHYQAGVEALNRREWDIARRELRPIIPYRDSLTLLKESYYRPALEAIEARNWDGAAVNILGLEGIDLHTDYRDLLERVRAEPALVTALTLRRQAAWQDGQIRLVQSVSAGDPINSLAFTADGQLLTVGTGSRVGTLQIWQLTPELQQDRFWGPLHAGPPIFKVAFSPDSQWVAATESNVEPHQQITELWPVDHRKRSVTIAAGGGTFLPTQNMLVAINRDGRVSLWRTPEGVLLTTLEGENTLALAVAASPDGRLIAACHIDGTIMVWRTGEQRPFLVLGTPQKTEFYNYGTITFSNDSALLAASVNSTSTRIWRVRDGILLRTLMDSAPVQSVAFSPNNDLLAVGTDERIPQGTRPRGYVMLWRVSDGQQVQVLTDHASKVTTVIWSPDGKTLVSGSRDQTVGFWRP